MSNDHLDEELRNSIAGVALDRPVSEVLARGDRLRRRRTRTFRAGVASVLAIGALGASTLLPSSEENPLTKHNPLVEPAIAVASLSGGKTNLTPAELKEVSDRCREAWAHGNQEDFPGRGLRWALPPSTLPVAAEIRDDLAVTYFKVGQTVGDCLLYRSPDKSLQVMWRSAEEYKPLPAGKHVDFTFGVEPGVGPDGSGPGSGVVQVSDDVAKLKMEVAGRTREVHLVDGFGVYWFTSKEWAATEYIPFTGYDDDGTALGQDRLGYKQ